jgi:hypothetical protein
MIPSRPLWAWEPQAVNRLRQQNVLVSNSGLNSWKSTCVDEIFGDLRLVYINMILSRFIVCLFTIDRVWNTKDSVHLPAMTRIYMSQSSPQS